MDSRYLTSFVYSVLFKCLGVVSGIVAARALGPAGRGELATLLYYPGLFLAIGSCAVSQGAAYISLRGLAPLREAVTTAYYASLIFGTALAITGMVLVPYTLPAQYVGMSTVAAGMFWLLPAAFCVASLNVPNLVSGHLRSYYSYQMAPMALYVLAMLVLMVLNVRSSPVMAVCCAVAHVVTGVFATLKHVDALKVTGIRGQTVVHLVKVGCKLQLPTVFTVVIQRLDMLLLIWLATSVEVGLYVAALAIANGQLGLSGPFAQLVFVDSAAGPARGQLQRQLQMTQLMIASSAVLSLVFGPLLLRFAFGRDFVGAMGLLLPLSLTAALRNGTEVLGQALRGLGLGGWLLGVTTLQLCAATALGGIGLYFGGPVVLAYVLLGLETIAVLSVTWRCCQTQDIPLRAALIDRRNTWAAIRGLFCIRVVSNQGRLRPVGVGRGDEEK